MRLVAQICKVPTAVISLIDSERQWFKAKVGTETEETPRSISFCTHTIQREQGDLLVVPDALKDPRFANSPLVTSNEKIRFYAGAPLVTRDGFALGALCAIDNEPRTLSEQDAEALRSLARHVVNSLEIRRLQRAHLQLKRELIETQTKMDALRSGTRPEKK